MDQLSSLSAGINATKAQYGREIATRRRIAGSEFAHSLCTLTEREWRKNVEAVKKGAESIGRVVAATAWVQPGMESAHAYDLPPDAKTPPDIPEQRFLYEGMDETSTLESSHFTSNSGRGPPSSSFSSRAASSRGPVHPTPLRPPPRPFSQEPSFASRMSVSGSLKSPYDSSEAFVRTVDQGIGNDASPTRAVERYQRPHQSGEVFSPVMSSEYPDGAAGTAEPSQNNATLIRSPAPTSPFSSSPRHSFSEDVFSRRQNSLVARLSRKYSENDSLAEEAPKPPPPQQQQQVSELSSALSVSLSFGAHEGLSVSFASLALAIQSWHKRSDSRVSQLAKRYSSPPAPLSPAPAGAPQPEPEPPFAPLYATSQQAPAQATPSPSSPGPQRYRAYQAAQPLPPSSPSLPVNRASYAG